MVVSLVVVVVVGVALAVVVLLVITVTCVVIHLVSTVLKIPPFRLVIFHGIVSAMEGHPNNLPFGATSG